MDVLTVFILLGVSGALFVTEIIPYDATAVLIIIALVVFGIMPVEEAFSGFGHPATVTIAAMLVLGASMEHTGVIQQASRVIEWACASGYRRLSYVALLLFIGVVSGFMNNTAVVAILLPLLLTTSEQFGKSPSRILMPLSFVSILGGACTLIGTSTNLLVGEIASQRESIEVGMFDFLPAGLVLFGAGVAYMFFFGDRLIPARRTEAELISSFDVQTYVADLVVGEDFSNPGRNLDQVSLLDSLDVDVVQVFREQRSLVNPARVRRTGLFPGDVLRVRGDAKEIAELSKRDDVRIRSAGTHWGAREEEHEEEMLVEVVVRVDAECIGRRLADIDFPQRFDAAVLALRARGTLVQRDVADVRLKGGDTILLLMPRASLFRVENDSSFAVVSRFAHRTYPKSKTAIAVGVLAGVVACTVLGVLPIAVSSVLGVVIVVLAGCMNREQALAAVNWRVILLLGGVIPLGAAMERTGAAAMLGHWIFVRSEALGVYGMLFALFLLTNVLTNLMSNAATVVIMTPIAINLAQDADIAVLPCLLIMAYGASFSFMTPVGYQTNLLIYGPGQYRFGDFLRVGTPLTLMCAVICVLAVPLFFPL